MTRAPAAKTFLKRWSRRLFVYASLGLHPGRRQRLTTGLRILTYHRLADDPSDPFAVRPQDFMQQMNLLHESRVVVPLEEGLREMAQGRKKSTRIAVTFDDG